jgi:hypothetical protein
LTASLAAILLLGGSKARRKISLRQVEGEVEVQTTSYYQQKVSEGRMVEVLEDRLGKREVEMMGLNFRRVY